MNKLLVFICFLIGLGCKTTEKTIAVAEPEMVVFDTLDISATEMETSVIEEPDYPYNPSAKRDIDILHTKLDVSFDWKNQHVLGEAWITLKPQFNPISTVTFDAKGMIIHGVENQSTKKKLDYEYSNDQLIISLDDELDRNDTIALWIDYTARPNASEGYSSGAISSDKGLFFIDPLDEDEHKPSQIWTQGETENNSRWFPTFDKPNERCSQEIFITVEDKYSTLSNGLLISSTKNEDGTRTDHWKQEKPHAPYLFMMAIGEFAWVNDKWNDLTLNYIVEKEYEASAKEIFDHTPEMLTYFSDLLDYPYPWDKYAQIITRDYVSGAMENTSAVIFGEFVQKHKRELIDNDNDYIVAHEMFHHWFGDLVTCESWANLTLNEGFANYSEYLWAEHKEGRMKADHHRLNEMQGYLSSGELHPLIHYHYRDKEDMFDAHSYNKGGLVLHMLRNYVGDDAFFASLSKYLKDNAFTAVEVDELRMAFEDITGEDLHWFFDQWYLREGHPIISVEYNYDEKNKQLNVYTNQVGKYNFYMPFDVAVYDQNGKATIHNVWIENELDTFQILNVSKPSNFVFDGTNTSLAIITESNKTDEQYYRQFVDSDLFYDKYDAFINIPFDSPFKQKVAEKALEESYYLFKEMALGYFSEQESTTIGSMEKIEQLVLNDDHSQVRLAGLELLVSNPNYDAIPMVEKVMANEMAYPVLAFGLGYLSTVDYPKALEYAEQLKDEKTDLMDEGLSVVFSQSEEDRYDSWFSNKVETSQIFTSLPLYMGYTAYSLNHNPSKVNEIIDNLTSHSLDFSNGVYQRYFSTMILSNLKMLLEARNEIGLTSTVRDAINEIKSKEKDPMLLGWYSQM